MSDGEHDSRSATADPLDAVAPPPGKREPLVPVHAVVFTLVSIVAIVVGLRGADTYHAAREAGAFTTDVRRMLAFTLLFNFSVLAALVLAFLGEGLRTVIQLARGGRPGRLLGRCGLALLPILVFGLGHAWLNPWLPALLRELRTLASKS